MLDLVCFSHSKKQPFLFENHQKPPATHELMSRSPFPSPQKVACIVYSTHAGAWQQQRYMAATAAAAGTHVSSLFSLLTSRKNV